MNERQDSLRSLMWSLWSELGAPGSERRHQAHLLDPEPLIVWTPRLAVGDNRLLGLALDWCVAHASLISKSRLAALARACTEPVHRALAAFNGAVAAGSAVRWTPSGTPLSLEVDRKVVALPLERRALLRLRMRSLVGVHARADVLTQLLAAAGRNMTADELTPAGMTRRSVERVVSDLVDAGFVLSDRKARGRRYRLASPRPFCEVMMHEPRDVAALNVIDWHRIFSVHELISELELLAGSAAGVRRVEAVKLAKGVAKLLGPLAAEHPPLSSSEFVYESVVAWGTDFAKRCALGDIPTSPFP